MYQDPQHVSVYINPDNHGLLHRDRWFAQGKPCPVAISIGHDPLLFMVACTRHPAGTCEYDLMGGIKGEPVEVIIDPHTGLPIPAYSEIVICGEFLPDDIRPEGPFGETFGYYASGVQQLPVVSVKAVYYRNNPIILGNPPSRPPYEKSGGSVRFSSSETAIERLRKLVPGVKDLYSAFPSAGGHVAVVAIEQQYPGHAMQAGLAVVNSGGHRPRYAIVVDDDVDIRNPEHLMWAVTTRTDPVKDVHFITRTTSSPVEPAIPPWEHDLMSRAIVDATRPYEWIDKFPPTVDVSPDLRERTIDRWKNILA
jgi:4-hydroxy-3-polyprenylbenzoate decarboxylase